MSKNWKEERRNQRLLDMETRARKVLDEAREDEKLIRMIESPLVTVSSGGRKRMCFEGSEIESRGLCLEMPDDTLLVEVGTNSEMTDDGLTVISITSLLNDKDSKFAVALSEAKDKVGLVFQGKNSLLQTITVFKTIGRILYEELRYSLNSSAEECTKENRKKRGGRR